MTKLAVVLGLAPSRGKQSDPGPRLDSSVWTDSPAEANRHVVHGNFYVNERKIEDPRNEVNRKDFIDKHIVILKAGAKNQVVLYIEGYPNP